MTSARWVSVPADMVGDVVELVSHIKKAKRMIITDEDLRSVRYFIEEKGDVTRWTDWDEKKAAIFALHPDLRLALNNMEVAELALKHALENLEC